jgi:O-antigen ligase
MRSSSQNVVVALVISFVVGVGLVLFTARFGYVAASLAFCAVPLGFVVLLWGLRSAAAKLETLRSQLRWWHFLWLFVFLSGQVFRIRDVASIQSNPLDVWALYRVGLMSIVALVLLDRLIFRHVPWDRSLFQGLISLLFGYAIISVVSTLWSVYPMWTLYKSVEYLVDVALIAAVVVCVRTVKEFESLFDFTWLVLSFFITNIWLGVVLWPGSAIIHGGLLGVQLQGILPAIETNGVGDLGAIVGIVALTRLLFLTESRRFYLVVFLISVVTLLISQSRSPLTGFLVGSVLVLFLSRRIGVIALVLLLIPALLSLTSFGDLFWEFFKRGQSTKYFESLSGRTAGWEIGWALFKERPFTGYGAYAGTRFAQLIASSGSSVLNTWLEVLVGSGLIGLTPLVLAFSRIWMVLLHHSVSLRPGTLMQRLVVEAIGVLAIVSVRTIFTVELVWHPPLTFLLILGYAELLRRASKEKIFEAGYSSVITQPVVNVSS